MSTVNRLFENMGISHGCIIGGQSIYNLDLKKDIDIVIDFNDNCHIDFNDNHIKSLIQNGVKIELINSSTSFLKTLLNQSDGISFADPISNYIIKMGHIHRPFKWYKHMTDINYLKDNYVINYYHNGYNVNDMIAIQRDYTDERLGKQILPKLNVTKDVFFDDGVKKYIDHDLIHELVAHNSIPVYKMMQKPNHEVLCDKSMWDNLSYINKIQAVLEECYVIALERFIIPSIMKGSNEFYVRDAFMWSLMRVSTDLTSGFFREFAIRNNKEILSCYNIYFYKNVVEYIKTNNLTIN